mmetsp:Transcript_16917/g.39008  ORF Transcript_16917/g.39008 Transcript_16917/m.39008 type:complete len:202 (-) Transcript_16917:75-680(-)
MQQERNCEGARKRIAPRKSVGTTIDSPQRKPSPRALTRGDPKRNRAPHRGVPVVPTMPSRGSFGTIAADRPHGIRLPPHTTGELPQSHAEDSPLLLVSCCCLCVLSGDRYCCCFDYLCWCLNGRCSRTPESDDRIRRYRRPWPVPGPSLVWSSMLGAWFFLKHWPTWVTIEEHLHSQPVYAMHTIPNDPDSKENSQVSMFS